MHTATSRCRLSERWLPRSNSNADGDPSIHRLFVAPVESDITSKAANKHGATSPVRSGIRRLRTDASDRRHPTRTANVRIYGAAPSRLPRSNPDGLMPSWADGYSDSRRNLTAQESRPWPNARERRNLEAQVEARAEAQAEVQVNSIFGLEIPSQPLTQRGPESRDAEQRVWPMDSRRVTRARINASYRDRGYDIHPSWGFPNIDDLVRSGESVLPPGTRSSAPRYNSRLLRSSRERRNALARNVAGLDGLGDRERSLSPEVWDTLLTTLTPDPQPPSASSSFASVTASQSQSAGPSSSTPTSAFNTVDGPVGDAQCDSDCGHSDADMDEDEDEESSIAMGLRSQGAQGRDGPRQANPYSTGSIMNRFGARQGAVQPHGDHPETGSGTQFRDMFTSMSTDVPRPPANIARILRQREQLPSDYQGPGSQLEGPERLLAIGTVRPEADESTVPRQSNGASGVTSGATSGGEEDWSGMQRIVRSLARREDIPDEWWAEVGLSRTLPQDETTNG